MEMECPKCWKKIKIPEEIEYTEGIFRCPYCRVYLKYEYDECCFENGKVFDCYDCPTLEINEDLDFEK